MLSFLEYYIRLRVGVLLGRRTTARPLGLCYRWRQWQYMQHQKRLSERSWLAEAAGETKSTGGGRAQARRDGVATDGSDRIRAWPVRRAVRTG